MRRTESVVMRAVPYSYSEVAFTCCRLVQLDSRVERWTCGLRSQFRSWRGPVARLRRQGAEAVEEEAQQSPSGPPKPATASTSSTRMDTARIPCGITAPMPAPAPADANLLPRMISSLNVG